jgi:alcohol dehydrogenase, propanol-preferring
MKAAVVSQLGRPLQIEDLPVPDPGPGQILVRMEASGLCHTDIHAARGDWPVKPTAPFIPGHEGVGIVEKLGPGVTERNEGDRVALPWLGHACGACGYCAGGWETLCLQQQNTGYSINGALAEYAVADARYAVPVPANVRPVDAAPLTCAGVTTYKAVKLARITPSERVGVFGVGGLGHLAVQYADLVGGHVIGIDVEEDKLRLATSLGAREVVDARQPSAADRLRDLGGLDVAIVLAATPSAFAQAFGALRRGGRLVCVGLPADGRLDLPIFDLVLGGISVIGSIVGTRQDLAEVFALHAEGRTVVISETRKIDEINVAMEDVLAGNVPARVVFEF